MTTEMTYNDFSWRLAAQYLHGSNMNSCISPPGIFLLSSAIAAASQDLTKEELDFVLGGKALQDISDGDHFANIRRLNDMIAQCSVLSNDTAMSIPDVYHLLPEYRDKLKESFDEKLKIGSSSDDAVVLENIIVFQDSWKYSFEETTEMFYKTPYTSSEYMFRSFENLFEDIVSTMPLCNLTSKDTTEAKGQRISYIHQEETSGIRVQESEEFISVAVPFSSDCHMVFSMPKNRPLDECLGDSSFLRRALDISTGRPAMIDLYLPSFKIKNRLNLIPILTAMGAKEVFDKEDGQITKMVNDRLYIESGNQETEVEVTVKGAYARALTRFRMTKAISGMSFYSPPKVVRFNHPFLFAIWQSEPTPVPLFIGTFQNPDK